jgi:hypothetical protein
MKTIERNLDTCDVLLNGDKVLSGKEFETVPSINDRLGMTEYQVYANTTGVSKTQKINLEIVEKQHLAVRLILDEALNDLKEIAKILESQKVPYIKGSNEEWKKD